MYHPVQTEHLAIKLLNSKVKERKGWRKEGKELAILYKILNREMSSNYKHVFKLWAVRAHAMEGNRGRNSDELASLRSEQPVTPIISQHYDYTCLVNVQKVTHYLVLWCFFSYETWNVSTGSIPGSSAFVWKKLDQTAKLRFAWPPKSTRPTCRRNASINGS